MLHRKCALSQQGNQNICLTRGSRPCSGLSAQLCIWGPCGVPGGWRLSTLHRVHVWGLQCWPGLWGLRQHASFWVKLSGSGIWRLRLSGGIRIQSKHGSAGFWGLRLSAWLWGKRSSSGVWGRGPSARLWWWLRPCVWHSRSGIDAAQGDAQLLSKACCLFVLGMIFCNLF